MDNAEIERQLDLARAKLGQAPEQALRALTDLGLNDTEIGRYHGIPGRLVTSLRAKYGIVPIDGGNQARTEPPDAMGDDGYLVEIQRAGGDFTKLRKPAPRRNAAPDASLRRFSAMIRSKLFLRG